MARSALVGGKLLATCAYMCLSLAINLAAFVVVFQFVPLERLGMSANVGALTALEFFAICLPFVPLGAALMMLVASFTRSYREAQTYLTSVLLVPTLPDRVREHLFPEDPQLADARPLLEPALADDQRPQG